MTNSDTPPQSDKPKKYKTPAIYKKMFADFLQLSGADDRYQLYSPTNNESAQKLKKWALMAEKLPTPWPQELIEKMVNHRPEGGKSSEFLRWVQKVHHNKDKVEAKKALQVIFKAGVSPSLYIPQAGVSIIGLAAYIDCAEIVELSYQYEQKEKLRLTLHAEHMGPNHPDIGSTLLHRLVERSGHGDKYLEIAKVITINDPEAVLQQTASGRFPHQMRDNDLSVFVLNTKSELEKDMLGEATVEAKSKKSPSLSHLKKM